MSLLVILGAGASYDSVNENLALNDSVVRPFRWKPPLTNQLFEPRDSFGAILSTTRRALDLVALLRSRLDRGDTDLQQELDRVQERADRGDASAAVQLMALRFYLREAIDGCGRNWLLDAYGVTNYHWLVKRLDDWALDAGENVIYEPPWVR